MNGFARLIKDGIRKLYGLIAVMVASIWLATITQSVLHPKPEPVGRSPVPKTNGLTIVLTEEQQPYFSSQRSGNDGFRITSSPSSKPMPFFLGLE